MLLSTVVYCGVVGFKGQCVRVGKHELTSKVDCNRLMYLLTSGGEFPIHSLNKRKRQQGDSEEQ